MFTVPLSLDAHHYAQVLRQHQVSPRKARQVYLNTLAVLAVNAYLQGLGVATNWEASDSADPTMASMLDVADLVVQDLGKIECRPILPEDYAIHIPVEVWADRVAFVAVELDHSLKIATLLGFIESVGAEDVTRDQLHPLGDLLRSLDEQQSTPCSNCQISPPRSQVDE